MVSVVKNATYLNWMTASSVKRSPKNLKAIHPQLKVNDGCNVILLRGSPLSDAEATGIAQADLCHVMYSTCK